MTAQHKQSQKGKGKLVYGLIPTSLFIGVGLGWALSRLITQKAVATQKKIVVESQRALQDRVRETLLAIDNELSVVKNAEYRQVLVDNAYRLMDLRLRTQLQESVNVPAAKTGSQTG